MSDTKDNRLTCEELEELVPELLYGELDDARAEQVRAQLPDCELDGKVAAYERMREAFRSLPDEEPPPAITAQLLHAAAKQVEGKRVDDGEGFWARLRGWFSPIVLHPGFAAATSILVIGGVVGLLYMKSSDQIAQPDVPTRATAPESREPAVAAPAGTATPALEGRLTETVDSEETAADDDGVAEGEAPPPPPVEKAEAKPKPKVGSKGRSRRSGRGNDKNAFDATGKSSGLIGGRGGGDSYKLGDTVGPARHDNKDVAVPQAPPADTRAPEPEPAPQAEADEAPAERTKSAKKAPSRPDPHADARMLHNQARSAAEKGDCAAARKLTARIQKMDPTYYRDSVRDDRQLRKCQDVGK